MPSTALDKRPARYNQDIHSPIPLKKGDSISGLFEVGHPFKSPREVGDNYRDGSLAPPGGRGGTDRLSDADFNRGLAQKLQQFMQQFSQQRDDRPTRYPMGAREHSSARLSSHHNVEFETLSSGSNNNNSRMLGKRSYGNAAAGGRPPAPPSQSGEHQITREIVPRDNASSVAGNRNSSSQIVIRDTQEK